MDIILKPAWLRSMSASAAWPLCSGGRLMAKGGRARDDIPNWGWDALLSRKASQVDAFALEAQMGLLESEI